MLAHFLLSLVCGMALSALCGAVTFFVVAACMRSAQISREQERAELNVAPHPWRNPAMLRASAKTTVPREKIGP